MGKVLKPGFKFLIKCQGEKEMEIQIHTRRESDKLPRELKSLLASSQIPAAKTVL